MQTQNIIERAFQLAPDLTSIDDIRKTLRQGRLFQRRRAPSGASIKADLKKRFRA